MDKKLEVLLVAIIVLIVVIGVVLAITQPWNSGCTETPPSGISDSLTAYALSDVAVTDAYLQNAERLEIEYLLSLDADRLLAGFRETAGLDTKGATRYDGWENSLIGGHTMGHYLTAMAQAAAALPDTDARKASVEERLAYIVTELKSCQDNLGTGFLFGAKILSASNVELQFDNVEKGLTNITTQAWVPWYTMHKILAGLVDVYTCTGNETALTVARSLGDWVYNRVTTWDEATRTKVLGIEYGGMNDCLYALYAVTGEDRYAAAAHVFDEDTLFQYVSSGAENALNGRHANTTIPKFLGAINRYITTNGKTINGETVDATEYLTYAERFFDMVVSNHTYITGDNSEWEHFGADQILDAERTNCNCETCNAYNMLKLAKALYQVTGDPKYTDFYENTFYNTILSSQNPETGMTTYFQPMASGYFKVYSTPYNSFWCCTGSGMENFTKLGNAIYYSSGSTVVVAQYLSSVLTDTDRNLRITQEADIPNSDVVTFTIQALDSSKTLNAAVAFRLPDWLAGEVTVTVNGTKAEAEPVSGCAMVSGLTDGDVIQITLPMEVRAYNLPDGENVCAFKYGPIVLSAELGTAEMISSTTGVAVTIPAAKVIGQDYISSGNETVSVLQGTVADFMANIRDNLVKTEGKLEWTLENTDANLTFVPHYSQHTERYGIYFEYVSNEGAFNANKYLRDKLSALFTSALLDTVQPAYGQYEDDALHQMRDNGSTPVVAETTRSANPGGSFTYTMIAAKGEDNYLQTTLLAEDNGKNLRISVGDTVVYSETLAYTGSEAEYTLRVRIPQAIVDAASYEKAVDGNVYNVVDVTFESGDANASARVCTFVYMTRAYGTDTSLTVSAGDLAVSRQDHVFEITADGSVSTAELTFSLATEFGYLRVNGSVIRWELPYSVDLSRANYVSLEITVFAEDQQTSETYTVIIRKDVDPANRADVDKTLAYYVNCGDYDVTTLPEGDRFGIYNGVTDMAYGMDPVTGYHWGIVDTVSDPLKNGTANNAAMTNAVFTDNTWTYETDPSVTDETAKTITNRYTKNQFENGIARNLNYRFELPDGEYTVKLYFTNPWNCSRDPIISAEGQILMEAAPINQEITLTVTVTDGVLDLTVTSPASTLCLNLAYILIYL